MGKKKLTVSETLRKAIMESGLTHYRIGKQTGIAPPVLDRFVSGERSLRLDTVDKIAEALRLELTKQKD